MGKGSAYGSAMYLNYYRVLYTMYFCVAIAYLAVYASISDQCRGVCPVSSFTDLTTPALHENRLGLDQQYLLSDMKWPLAINKTAGETEVPRTAGSRLDLADCSTRDPNPSRCSDTVLPAIYTHYFACNLTADLGEYWWDNKTTSQIWNAASKAGAGGSNPHYWGAGRKYLFDKRESACFICCDPKYMTEKSRCRPSVTSVSVYTFCTTASECQSGFKPAAQFPVPPRMIWATFQADVLLILGVAYAAVGFFSAVVACGYSVYSGKYELDFKEDNLTISDKCCGALAKNGPWLMRLINIGMLVLTIFQIYSLTTLTCFDGHDQFGNFTYFDTMFGVISFVSAIFFLTCIGGTYFRATTDPDPAFYDPPPNPDPTLHGRSCIDLCCHDAYCDKPCMCCKEDPRQQCECGGCKIWAAICLMKRRCCWAYTSCGP